MNIKPGQTIGQLKQMDTTEKLFSPDEAIKAAAQLRLGDPDYEYIVCHDPKGTGYSFIEVWDEDGFVSKF